MCVVFSNTLQMTYLKITSSEGYWKILCLGLNILYKAWEKVLKNTLSWAQYIMHHSFKQQSQENNFKKTYPNCNFPFKIFLDKRLYHCIGNKLPFPYHSVWCSIPHGVFVWSCGPQNHNFLRVVLSHNHNHNIYFGGQIPEGSVQVQSCGDSF